MRKKILSAIIILAMIMSTCMVAVAAENPFATKNSLHSNGAIHYSQGGNGVVIDSADLYTLADQLDLFKVQVTKQLGTMHTYLTRAGDGEPLASADGVRVVHTQPGGRDEVDPLSLDFAAVLEGIAASQSIPTDPAAYSLSSSTILYKTPEGRLETTDSEGAEPIDIHAATADNLSAGAAAWVDGRLLLGTGADVADVADAADAGPANIELTQADISLGCTMTENIKTAFAYVHTIGVGNSNSAPTPVFIMTGGGTYDLFFDDSYAKDGFNVKVALYHLKNIPKGAVITGSNGLLFYCE